MKICCIDDDTTFLKLLNELIIRYSIKNDIDIIIKEYDNIPKTIPSDTDAYFVDIMMKDKTIFDFVTQIRNKDLKIPIVFFSNYDSFVFRTTKFNIFDFIRKKYICVEFDMMMDKLVQYYYSFDISIFVKYKGILQKVKLTNIIYLESFSHTTVIHFENESIEIKKSINEVFQDKIKHFTKIHRSYYININYLKTLSKNHVVLFNNVILPVSKTYIKNIENDFVKSISNVL